MSNVNKILDICKPLYCYVFNKKIYEVVKTSCPQKGLNVFLFYFNKKLMHVVCNIKLLA